MMSLQITPKSSVYHALKGFDRDTKWKNPDHTARFRVLMYDSVFYGSTIENPHWAHWKQWQPHMGTRAARLMALEIDGIWGIIWCLEVLNVYLEHPDFRRQYIYIYIVEGQRPGQPRCAREPS